MINWDDIRINLMGAGFSKKGVEALILSAAEAGIDPHQLLGRKPISETPMKNAYHKFHFDRIEQLLVCADKIVSRLERMFPAEDKAKLRFAVLDSLLSNSILEHQ